MLKLLALLLLAGTSKSDKVDIDCKYGLENYEHIKNINRCLVNEIDLVRHENVDVNVKNIQTQHGGRLIPANIHGFEAEKRQILFFPGQIGKIFPNIKAVKVVDSNLRKLSANDFGLIRNLEYLDLSHNRLLILDANLFQNTPQLQIIKLNDNKIYYIHPSAFSWLTNLRKLILFNNICYTGSAFNLEDALALFRISLCSNDLLHSCGAFSQALAMAGENTFANHFGMFNTDPQKQLDDIMAKLQNDNKMFFDSFKNSNSITIVNETNNTGSTGDHEVLEAIRQLNLTFHNKCKSINKKLEAEVHQSNSNISQQQIEIILKSFNDSNNELLLKFHIIYMSLLACIILLLITIVVIMCCKKSSNLSKTDVKIDDEYKIPYNYESQQKAPENHYQMTNIVGQEVRNRENQQYSCQDQQEYEEIPENAYNKSQISNKRTGNNNDDDFYEEQPSFRDAYSHAKGKKDYAVVYGTRGGF